jgi:aromatic ring-opening dioxygenase LigB subunit
MPSISIGLVLSVLACVASWEQFAVHGVVIGAAVLPHGDFVYDPTLVGRGSLRVHNAALKAGAFIDGLQPDIIVLTTPHGMTLDSQLALYGDTQAGGFANIGQDLHNKSAETYRIRANVTLATNITAELAESLGPLAAKLSMFGGSEQMPLRWGEVIPLSFIPNRRRTKVGSQRCSS